MPVLLPYTYMGPVSYYSCIAQHRNIALERHENFPKQTFRNRCTIYGTNVPLNLIVPVEHRSGERSISDKRISYRENWQKLHWKSLETAYRSSPFFEYYEDDFLGVLMKKHELLIDLNAQFMSLILKILDIEVDLSFTSEYKEGFDGLDLREDFTPNADLADKEDFQHYTQVFEDRHGFLPNLSIADLIFSQGPRSRDYL